MSSGFDHSLLRLPERYSMKFLMQCWLSYFNNVVFACIVEFFISQHVSENILPQRKLEQVYKALFESHLRYGNIVWSALSSTKLSQLQRLQTRAKELIKNAKYKDGWTCKWLTVNSLISFDKGVMTYRILHDLCPENLRHKFTERSVISDYRTRNFGHLQIPKVRLEYAKRSFYFSGVKNWNYIPNNIREKESVARFRTGFREYLLNLSKDPNTTPW